MWYLLALFISISFAQTPFSGLPWQQQSNTAKINVLEPTIYNNTTPGVFPSTIELAEIFLEDMSVSFDTQADDMPYQFVLQRRPKLIHSVGPILDAVWSVIPNNLGYTGIFESGCDNLFIRLSCATQPVNGTGGYVPAIALKCLRSGVPSGNMFAMYSLQGQDSWNFFKHDLTNHVPDLSSNAPFILQELRNVFAAASNWPVMIGLSNLAAIDQNGVNATSPTFPFRLVFHPTKALHNAFPDTPQEPFQDVLVNGLQTPSDLYYIYAVQNPNDSVGQFVHIGTITSTMPATTSNFGDVLMFFQHTRMENDFMYRPDWADPATAIMAKQRSVDYYTYPDLPFN